MERATSCVPFAAKRDNLIELHVLAAAYHERPCRMLGIDPDDPYWNWAAYQLDVAAYVAGQQAINEQSAPAAADDWSRLPRMSARELMSLR